MSNVYCLPGRAGGFPEVDNQAVTNVIESFRSEAKEPFASRWLPGIDSYGLYWPAAKKDEEARKNGFQFVSSSGQGDFPAILESQDFFEQAKTHFLETFAGCLGTRPSSMQEAVADLHQRLVVLVGRLQAIPSAYLAFQEAEGLNLQPRQTALRASHAELLAADAALVAKLQKWMDFQAQHPWWMTVFSFLPGVRAQKAERVRSFVALHQIDLSKGEQAEAIGHSLRRSREALQEKLRSVALELEAVETQERRRIETLANYQTLRNDLGLPPGATPPEQDLLDTHARFRAFLLACHYWEARWLLEREQEIQQPSLRNDPHRHESLAGRLAYLRKLAMLAPCSVATLFRVPMVLSSKRPRADLWEALDLLIVDEAGQVSPEVGGIAFAFAKRALVVGDTLQIEPVWNIPARVDRGNIAGAGFEADSFPQAYRASEGNLMGVAQMVSPFRKHSERGGMFLSEHFRCVQSLIAYCNELAYDGHLAPKREDPKQPGPFPIWGYAHVPGWTEKKHGQSLGNPMEAAAIAQWISDHRSELESLDDQGDLAKAIAVVAPFAYQRELVQKELRARELPEITVGTVHALQGAERPLVIFSPTCTRMEPRPFFFDRGVQMLNVAVSRAKDSFLVFGDMDIFVNQETSRLPSGLLSQHLFRSPENALEGYGLPQPVGASSGLLAQAERIASLDGHREALADCIEQATRRLVVVSPWITADALKADDLPQKIAAATDRQVSVLIYTDRLLNSESAKGDNSPLKATAEAAVDLLLGAGAEIRWAKNIHNKNLLVDEHTVILGSFNWLSARRSETDRYHRFDSSIRFRGAQAKEWIEQFHGEMEERVAGATYKALTFS